VLPSFQSKRELVQRMVMAELLAQRGQGPLARRVLFTRPREAQASAPSAASAPPSEPGIASEASEEPAP